MLESRSKRIVLTPYTLVALCGIAGSGKSTFAAKQFLSTQIVSSDDCRARICDDATNQEVNGPAFELWRSIIRTRLWLGRLTVADATNLDREDRKWLVKAAHNYQFNAAVILFDIPLETALARNAARDRVVPEEALLRQHDLLRNSLRSIHQERFDSVFVLTSEAQSEASVEIRAEAEKG